MTNTQDNKTFAESIAKAVNEIWRVPKFTAHRTKDLTEFVFSLPYSIPRELERRNLTAYGRLFPTGRKGLSKVFVKAYRSALRDGRPVKKETEALLREVVVRALQILLEEHKDVFHQDQTQITEEQTMLRKGVIKSGPRSDERHRNRKAIRLAKRYKEILPDVKKIWHFVNERKVLSDPVLKDEIDRAFPLKWVSFITRGAALTNLLPIAGHESRIRSLHERWTPRQLAVGILVCEEQTRTPGIRLGASTMYDEYILLGNNLISDKNKK
jgi:hypothetical protein